MCNHLFFVDIEANLQYAKIIMKLLRIDKEIYGT